MPNVRHLRAMTRGFIVAILATAAIAASAEASPSKSPAAAKSAPPVVEAPAPPAVGETRVNLQKAFANEMNAKERYTAFARQAVREGYPAAARLFLACAQAEQIHADRHVHAIAWTGGEARVLLDRVYAGTTAENLQTAIQAERYESTEFYPAFLARARADFEPEAVRSMNFALSAEREHEQLLTAALASLDLRPPPRPLYVCSYCGKTVEARDFEKCPNCFTSSKKFIRVGEEPPTVAARAGATSPEAVATPKGTADRAQPPAPPEPRK